jgi:hypothetical protein
VRQKISVSALTIRWAGAVADESLVGKFLDITKPITDWAAISISTNDGRRGLARSSSGQSDSGNRWNVQQ